MPKIKNNNSISLTNSKDVINPLVIDLHGLSHDEMKFCSLYVINNFNATEAALQCGYAPGAAAVYGSYFLKKSRVNEHIKNLLMEEENKLGVNRVWKISTLKKCIEEGMTEKNYAAVIAAVKELNGMQGDYAPTRTINANFNMEAHARYIKDVDESIGKYKKEY